MPEEKKPNLSKTLLIEHLRMAQLFLTHQDYVTLGVGQEQQTKALGHVLSALWELGES